MKAMILAAGRGARMGALTDNLPKPLLDVGGKPLIAHQLIALSQIGVKEIVINLSYLAEKIRAAIGNGMQYGVSIEYSYEPEALETGGGIYKALPLLGPDPFLVISGDIWTDYPFEKLAAKLNDHLAHLILVDNPSYHLEGDYSLKNGKVSRQGSEKFTFASMGIYHPDLFKNCRPGFFRLTEVLNPAIDAGKIGGEHYRGEWVNVGTREEWERLFHNSTCNSGATTTHSRRI